MYIALLLFILLPILHTKPVTDNFPQTIPNKEHNTIEKSKVKRAVTYQQKTTIPTRANIHGCEYNGVFYPPGEINRETDNHGWCGGLYCSWDGNILAWDDWNCRPTDTTAKLLATTVPQYTSAVPLDTKAVPLHSTLEPLDTTAHPLHTIPDPLDTTSDPQYTTSDPQYTNTNPLITSADPQDTKTRTTTMTNTRTKEFTIGVLTLPHARKLDKKSTPTTNISNKAESATEISTTSVMFNIREKTTRGHVTKKSKPLSIISELTSTALTKSEKSSKGRSSPDIFGVFTTATSNNKEFGEHKKYKTTHSQASFKKPTLTSTKIYTGMAHVGTNVHYTNFKKSLSSLPFVSDSTAKASSTVSSTTRENIGWCFFKGRYFEDGDIISRIHHGWNWCSGWRCNQGKVDSWVDYNCPNPTTLPLSTPTTTNELVCLYKGVRYKEGELINTEGSGDCTMFYCTAGTIVPLEGSGDSSDSTSKTLGSSTTTSESNIRSTDVNNLDTLSTKHLIHHTNIQPETTTNVPAKSDKNSNETIQVLSRTETPPSFLTVPSSTMIMAENFTESSSAVVLIKSNETVTIAPRTTKVTVTPNTNDELYKTEIDKVSTTEENSFIVKPPRLCFHKGNTYAEGDMVSENFEEDDWCSGWICKDQKMVPIDCKSTFKDHKDKNKIAQPITPNNLLNPEPSICLHKGRYYEEGDVATIGDNWCTYLICKNRKMLSLSDCEAKVNKTKHSSWQLKATSETYESSYESTHESVRSTKVMTTKTSTIITGNNRSTSASSRKSFKATHSNFRLLKKGVITTLGPKVSPNVLSKTVELSKKKTTIRPSIKETPNTQMAPLITTEHSGKVFLKLIATLPPLNTTPKETVSPLRTSKKNDIKTSPNTAAHTTNAGKRTTPPETQNCFYEGKLYPPGDVTKGVLRDGRCFGVVCDISGVIIQWVTALCEATEPPTPEFRSSLPGCIYRDKYYPPGIVSRVLDGSNWCVYVVCTNQGNIVTMNSINCYRTTTVKSTAPPTMKPKSCLYNGMMYPVGVITQGIDKTGWCYKVVCEETGHLYMWGDWNCPSTTTTTQPPVTTQPNSCDYNGRNYPVGEITRGKDESGWCYGVNCRDDGQVVMWGSFRCTKL